MMQMTKSDALKLLGERKLQLEEMLQVHSETTLAEMAKMSRPVFLAVLQKAIEQGKIEKGKAALLKRMIESTETPVTVIKASRTHIDAGLDDGARTEADDALVRKIRATLAGVEAAIASLTGSSSLSKAGNVLNDLSSLAKSVYSERFGI